MSSISVMSVTTATATAATVMAPNSRRRGCNGPPRRAPPKMSGKLLQCRANSEDFGRKLTPRFILSDELYIEKEIPCVYITETEVSSSPPTSTMATMTISSPSPPPPSSPSSSSSSILNLPFEIISLIYRALDCAPSQISLALSCKRMALVARDVDLSLSVFSAKYAGFLPREVFDVPVLMRQLRSWMPENLRLCDHCLTARPAGKEYWLDVDGCGETSNFWITKTGWTFMDASWHKQVHNICPACRVSCSLSDYVDCDGCRALGRLGDVDWSRVSDHWKRNNNNRNTSGGDGGEEAPPPNHWDLTG